MEVTARTEVREAAREFGEVLANCEEWRALQQSQEALDKDREARELLSNYQATQRSVQMTEMWGGSLPLQKGELDELKNLEAKINSNHIIKAVLDAQKRLQEMLLSLNNEISGLLGIDFAANSSASGCC